MSHGKLLGIAIREKSRAAMEELDAARVTRAAGVTGDSRGRPGKRQVTVLDRAAWEQACHELGQDLPWTIRRANLLVEGIGLCETAGLLLRIGDVALRICGETDPCQRMDEQVAGLSATLEPQWRGGVCCRVESEGEVRVGDEVRFEPDSPIDES